MGISGILRRDGGFAGFLSSGTRQLVAVHRFGADPDQTRRGSPSSITRFLPGGSRPCRPAAGAPARRRAGRDGAEFSMVPRRDVPAIMPELRAVSDSWLAEKRAGEKRFSMGY